jgi:Flp pilus assembly pilin Flp
MVRLLAVAKNLVPRKEDGAALVEYALLLAVIAAVCIAAVTLVGSKTQVFFSRIAEGM